MIKGKITVNNSGLANQEILFISREDKKIAGSALTDKSGVFHSGSNLAAEKPLDVLCKIRQDNLVSIYYAVVDSEKEMNLNIDTAAFFDVVLEIKSDIGYPPQLNVFIDPVAFKDMPDYLGKFFNMKSETEASSYFYRKPFSERSIKIKLREGIYNIGGEYILYDSPGIEGNYIVKEAVMNGGKLVPEGNVYNGFRLSVTENCSVQMILGKLAE